jgi:nitroreductase
MEMMEVLKNRRAVREYTNAQIQRSTVERLISSAILAPSAMNLQPWAFAVILDRTRIEEYGKRARDWALANFSQTGLEPRLRQMLEDPNFVMFYHAPALILILAKSSEAQSIEDCGLAAENFMLAARDEGLGTCWIGLARPWLNLPATKAELKLPKDYCVVVPLILGVPKAWPESHGRNAPEIYWLG